MIYFCDNDIIQKVAAFDLWGELLATLGLQRGDLTVLSTAQFKFGLRDPAKGEGKYGPVVFGRIRDVVTSASTLTQQIDPVDEALLAEVLGIDAGEAQLFSAASRDSTSILATGDKRSLLALLGEPKCAPIATRLAGRVHCLETLVRQMIQQVGFTSIKAKVVPAYACDTGIRAAFGSGLESTQEAVLAGLDAYLGDFAKHNVKLFA